MEVATGNYMMQEEEKIYPERVELFCNHKESFCIMSINTLANFANAGATTGFGATRTSFVDMRSLFQNFLVFKSFV